jgi:hypothetical protein
MKPYLKAFLICFYFALIIDAKTILKAATYDLPQNAITDGITRYHSLIDYALEYLNEVKPHIYFSKILDLSSILL